MKAATPPLGAILLDPRDSVATVLAELAAGQAVWIRDSAGAELLRIETCSRVPAYHKIALREHAPGETVIKYGEPIGIATRPILPGEHVHSHNLRSLRGESDEHPGL
jgi:hypothetical protein